jgi:hypothetical protein
MNEGGGLILDPRGLIHSLITYGLLIIDEELFLSYY